jgi:hypothetical protein
MASAGAVSGKKRTILFRQWVKERAYATLMAAQPAPEDTSA